MPAVGLFGKLTIPALALLLALVGFLALRHMRLGRQRDSSVYQRLLCRDAQDALAHLATALHEHRSVVERRAAVTRAGATQERGGPGRIRTFD